MTEKLPSLMIVIAVGKGGKSTALNFILHSISYDGIAGTEQVEENRNGKYYGCKKEWSMDLRRANQW